jgi:hypothetical protein
MNRKKNNAGDLFDTLLPFQTSSVSTLGPTTSKMPINLKNADRIGPQTYIPVRYGGAWRDFLEEQRKTIDSENKARRNILRTKHMDPLLGNINILFFGDSYARLLEPPTDDTFVISYPGIPVKSLTRSIIHPTKASRKNQEWINTELKSGEPKKKKIFLSFSSPRNPHLHKKMFYDYSPSNPKSPKIFSYPRVDLIRQVLRFPEEKIHAIGFWFGNAELQLTWYYDLYHKLLVPLLRTRPDVLEDSDEFFREYDKFLHQFITESTQSYLQFLKTIHRLDPHAHLFVVLVNYSPVSSENIRRIVPENFSRLKVPSPLLSFIFGDKERRNIVDIFNSTLKKSSLSSIRSGTHGSRPSVFHQYLHFIDTNPLLLTPTTHQVKSQFILHPRDIHLADPHRKIYEHLVKSIHHVFRTSSKKASANTKTVSVPKKGESSTDGSKKKKSSASSPPSGSGSNIKTVSAPKKGVSSISSIGGSKKKKLSASSPPSGSRSNIKTVSVPKKGVSSTGGKKKSSALS